MAFGKKKKKDNKKQQNQIPHVTSQKVPMSQNPLYPPKKESALKETGIALGVLVVCLMLSGLIITKFSYASTGYPNNNQVTENDVSMEQEESTVPEDEIESEDIVEPEDSVEQEELQNEIDELFEEEEEEMMEEENDDYIIPDSDTRRISRSELEGMSAEELRRARNEIYARHGRRFKDEELQRYFNSKDWYEGTIDPDDFTQSMLNKTEIENAEKILDYEESMGYR